MAVNLRSLTRLGVGIEAANAQGTLVPATMGVPAGDMSFTPAVERKILEESNQLLAHRVAVPVKRESTLDVTTELAPETLLPVLLCSAANTAPTTGNDLPQSWVFEPSIAAPSALDTATWEISLRGSAAGRATRFGYARPTSWSIEASGETSQLSAAWMGRAEQPLPAAAAVAVPDRWIVPAALWRAWIDDTWAALGTTAFSRVRSVQFEFDPGLTPAPTFSGRPDLDMSDWWRGKLGGKLTILADHDAAAAGEIGHWRAGDKRFVRLEATNSGSAAGLRRIRIDACVQMIDDIDVLSVDDERHTVELAGDLFASDDTTAEFLAIAVDCGLGAV